MNKKELAKAIIDYVGGTDNIDFVTHCMTRLRFHLKDVSRADIDRLKALQEVMGVVDKGGQFQLIIGPTVPEVFHEVSSLLPAAMRNRDDKDTDRLEEVKKKGFSVKGILNSVMETVSACVTPLIPIITAAGLIKLVAMLLGANMLNVLSETSNLLRLLTFVGDAGFYFFPIYVAYGAAKKFNTSILITLFMAAILLHPTLMQIAADNNPFDVYGIPMVLTNYSSTFLPMILITWVMSYIERGLQKIIPMFLKPMLVPLLTILIMLPIALCGLGPIGSILGIGIANVITWLYSVFGPLAVGLVGATWPLLIATGMHQAMIPVAIASLASVGHDSVVFVGAGIGCFALMGIALAFVFKTKSAENKAVATTNFITFALGGISEPVIFGVLLKFKKSIVYLMVSGFIGGFIAGLLNVGYYFFGATSVFAVLSFAGDNPNSFTYGVIASVIAFVLGFIFSMIFGFEDKKKEMTAKKRFVKES